MICAPNPTRILMLFLPRAYYSINMPEQQQQDRRRQETWQNCRCDWQKTGVKWCQHDPPQMIVFLIFDSAAGLVTLPLLRANCAHRSCSVPGKPWSSGAASAAPALHEGSCKEPAMHLHCSTSTELGSRRPCSGHGCPQQLTAGTAKPAGIHLSTQIFTKYDLIPLF